MSKEHLSREIRKEIEILNDQIDLKIIKGLSYRKEAQRHMELLATLRQLAEDEQATAQDVRRPLRRVKSPVRRRLAGGVFSRLFNFGLAA